MANNYFSGTMSPDSLKLTEMHKVFLEASEAGIEGGSYVYWEESLSESADEWEYSLKEAIKEERITSDEAGFISNSSFEEMLRHILAHNPEHKFLKIEFAHYCSKMRPDNFGGISLLVTKDQYCWHGTGNTEVDSSGKIVVNKRIVDF